MNILSLCAIAIVSISLALVIKRYNPETALFISIGTGILILLSIINDIVLNIEDISDLLSDAAISKDYITILIKVLGICFLTEFTCDCTKEAGFDSLTNNISLAGKILVLIIAMPLFKEVISVVTTLCGG